MELLVDEKSALAHANLRAMILDPEVWKLLTPEQAALVRKYLPNTNSSSSSSSQDSNGDGDVGEALAALASNDHLRHDIAQYQKELSDGQHDPEWIRQAREANKLRNEAAAAEAESENASGSERDAKKKAKDTNGVKTEAKEGGDGDHHMTDA
ncbi:hypothetical protein KJ359_007404 [Pestalotiopsis sp. 9143b]|nr:hypothetical protein KJ359_007404 [Pestalotiopsis sp. 9143b]